MFKIPEVPNANEKSEYVSIFWGTWEPTPSLVIPSRTGFPVRGHGAFK